MWCDVQSPVMMGLQVTANKRKLEEDGVHPQPAKLGRKEEMLCGAAPDLDDWRLDSTSAVLATALLAGDPAACDDDEEEDDEEEDEEDDNAGRSGGGYPCIRYGGEAAADCYPGAAELKGMGYYGAGEDHASYGGASALPYQYLPARTAYWGSQGATDTDYYSQDPGSQQTIRCDENGKSYLDLGSSSARYVQAGAANSASGPGAPKCCDGGRTNWCSRGPSSTCYRQRRLAVLNISMCKLGRYRQFPDPSLRRSVLICNTLRRIEREMEQEGFFFNSPAAGGHHAHHALPPQPPQPVEAASSYAPGFPEVPVVEGTYRGMDVPSPYEQNLREFSSSGRSTPFPHGGHEADSGLGDDESARGINWGSVLSLSSQSDLDPLNNNELYPPSPPSDSQASLCLLPDMDLGQELDDFLPSWKLTPLSAEDILKTVPSTGRQGEGELDSIMHVLVGT